MRYLLRNLYFSVREITKNIFRTLLSSFGIVFLIVFLVVYLTLRESVKEYIGGSLFGTLQINEVIVSPPSVESDIIDINAKSESISPAKVARIRAIKGIGAVHPVIQLTYPVKIKIEMLGQTLREYLPIYGVSRDFLSKTEKRWRQFTPGAQVPILVPKFALEIFNNLLTARGLPRLGEKALRGFPMQIEIQTTARGAAEKKVYKTQGYIFSFTQALALSGLVLPLDYVTKFCAEHRGDSPEKPMGYSYVKLFVTVKNVKELPEISKQMQRLGLKVESQQDIASKTNKALSIMDSSSMVLIGVFLILTVISIFNSYLTIVYHRSYTFSLQRVIGVSKIRIIMTFVVEAAIIGALYGLVGYFGGVASTEYLSKNIARWVPVLKGLVFKPASEGLLPMAVGLSALLSSVSAFLPAVFASNMNLFKAVQK